MASRKEQKEQARAQRIEQERASEAAALRRRRLQFVGAITAIAVVVVVVAIVVSTSGSSKPTAAPKSTANVAAAKRVETLLTGLQQSAGNTLGNPKAPVTITEFGDLECSVCDEFDIGAGVTSPGGVPGTGILESIIQSDVATGKAKLVYKSLETATGNGVTPNMWTVQQAAANAAGLQNKAWDYIELFYNEQGAEGTNYVTMSYLEGLAKQVPGLNYNEWLHDLNSDPAVRSQVKTDNTEGTQLDEGEASTPTIWVKGPKNQASFEGITQSTAAKEIAMIQQAVTASA